MKHKPFYLCRKNALQPNSQPNSKSNYQYDINDNGSNISTILNAYGIKPSLRTDIKIGIIELGGGYLESDLEACMAINNFPDWKASEHVFPYFIDGYPTDVVANFNNDLNSSEEVELDIEIISNCIPNGRINVYFAPNDTNQQFIDAFTQAINDNCTVISCSWGQQEYYYDNNSIFTFEKVFEKAKHKGISIFIASGDRGNTDSNLNPLLQNNGIGFPVYYPASSPNVIACGGTILSLKLKNGEYTKYSKETSWIEVPLEDPTNIGIGTGGESMYFSAPTYQKKLGYKKRTVPDISGNASFIATPWLIYYNGAITQVGGTSCVAPMWAGYIGGLGCNVFLNNYLYRLTKKCFHDITMGQNYPYEATPGYDLCTGLGSPNGEILTKYLKKIFKK